MQSKLVFLDIDGTLLDKGEIFYPSTEEALKEARKNGHKLFLCTGREKAIMPKVLKNKDLDNGVFSAGANVFCDNKIVFHKSFDKDVYNKIINTLLELEAFIIAEKEEGILYMSDTLKRKNMHYVDLFKLLDAKELKGVPLDSEDTDKILYFEQDICIDPILEKLSDICHIVPMSYSAEGKPMNSFSRAEIMQKGINKGTGIQNVLDYYNADISDSVAIGDSDNDLEMLEYSAISVCMGNGTENAKNSANYISKDIADDGLYDAFKIAGLI